MLFLGFVLKLTFLLTSNIQFYLFQSWSDVSNMVGRDGLPMMMPSQQQQQPPQMNRSMYPPGYSNPESHNQQQLYRFNSHSNCAPQQQVDTMAGSGGEGSYPSSGGPYALPQNCQGHMNPAMVMGNQYQYQQRVCQTAESQAIDHHCQQKPLNPQQQQQQMMHQQQQMMHQQQHFQQISQHMMQTNPPRPQMQHMQHQQTMSQQAQQNHQHYERMTGPPSQYQYHQQDHKSTQHQHCAGKQLPSRENYQRPETPQQVHQVQQGMVLQTPQGQVMMPQQAMVMQQQQHQQQNVGMQVSHSQTMIQSSAMVVQSPNHSIQQSHQSNQMVMQQHQQTQQGVQVQMPNQQVALPNHQQQNVNQMQNNSTSNTCSSPAMLMHHQRPAPPWQTNRNNQLLNQNSVINQQPQPPTQTQPNQQQVQHQVQQQQIQQQHIQQQQVQQQQVQQQVQQQQIQQQAMQPNTFERVPPLHHHLPTAPVWNDDRKKLIPKLQGKPAAQAVPKNKILPYLVENQQHSVGVNCDQQCPNVDVRQIPQEQNKLPGSQSHSFANTNNPSFMEDPSGYLAQQTALLNSTISRQTGMNVNGVSMVCQNSCSTQMNDQNSGQGQVVINLPTSSCSPVGTQGVPLPSNVLLPNQQKQNYVARANTGSNSSIKVYRGSSGLSSGYQNQTQSHPQPGLPDSSGVSPDRGRCSQGCGNNTVENFLPQNQTSNHKVNQNTVTLKFQPEESPVTSSTFQENRQQLQSVSTPDSRGPIQGGTVSTSNRSPAEVVTRIPPDDPSPGRTSTPSSTHSRRLDASPEPSMFITTSSPFTLANGNTIIYHHTQLSTPNTRQEVSTPIAQSPKPHQQQQQINLVLQDVSMPRLPTIVTTMASGHTVSSNTITSVLAGRANTATVTVNNQTSVAPPTVPPAVMTNQHIPQVSVSKSPLEMVQSVVSSIQIPASSAEAVIKPATAPSLPAGHILMSSNGQLIVTNSQGQPAILSPQQSLTKLNTSMPPLSGVSTIVTSVAGAVNQVIPTVGVTQQVLGQPTVLVNTLPAPLLFQPGVMTVDGTMNTVQIPHLAVATGNVIPGQMVDESRVSNTSSGAFSPRNQPALLSPEGSNGKRKAAMKKRKVSPQTVASMLHIAAQQNSPTAGATGMVVQQQQPQQNFSPQMLQALTILPSKTGHFGGTQQLIATGNILQPLNLVQNFPTIQQFLVPAGLGGMVMATGDGTATLLQDTVQLNVLTPMQGHGGTVFGHTSGQSILAASPAGMVIRTPSSSNQQTGKVQLQPQNSATNQFITTSSPNQFIVNNSAFGGQLSPMLANVSPTNQQIHSFNSGGGNSQNRPNQTHQEFIQCGQTLMVPCSIAQNPPAQNTTVVQQNTTIVQQQTTMVSNNQQNLEHSPGPSTSTSSSSLSLNQHNFILNNADGKQQNFILTTDQKGQGGFILSPNPDKPGTHILLNTDKAQYGSLIISQDKPNQMCGNFILSNSNIQQTEKTSNNFIISGGSISDKHTTNRFAKHSVSTQTAANQQVLHVSSTPIPTALVVATSNTFCQTSTAPSSYSGSPPDTTTHSPVDGATPQSPGINLEAPSSSVAVGSTDDLSSPTSSSDLAGRAQPMVHCVSSSNEQDTPEWKETPATSPAMFSPPPNTAESVYNRGNLNKWFLFVQLFSTKTSISICGSNIVIKTP